MLQGRQRSTARYFNGKFPPTIGRSVGQVQRTARAADTYYQSATTVQVQQESLDLLQQRMDAMTDLQQRIGELLDSELHRLWDQPILFKGDVMKKLEIQDSAYRNYVREGKLRPMSLGRIDWFFQRDVVKLLLESKGKHRRSGS